MALVVVMAVTLAACGGDSGGPEQDAVRAQPTQTEAENENGAMEPVNAATVEMSDEFTFQPDEIVLKAGGKVTWVNSSETTHTTTADRKKAADAANVALPPGAEPWNSKFMDPGERFSLTLDEPGTYRYFCIPHEKVGMLGTIRVVD